MVDECFVGLWSRGTCEAIITCTEFQKRGWAHWHILVFLDLPWELDKLHPDHEDLPEVLNFFDQHVVTDKTKTLNHQVQYHHHTRDRCFPGRSKNVCKYGFPRFPFSK